MGDETTMNKKGELALRNIMFMLIIFSSVLLLLSLFVIDMSTEYENTDMNTEYSGEGSIGDIGSDLYQNTNSSISTMQDNIDDGAGSFGIISGIIGGVGTILKTVILAPVYVGTALTSLMIAFNVPTSVSNILKNLIIFGIYIVIIFVIVSALSRGGTKL